MTRFTVFDPSHIIRQLFCIFHRSSRRRKSFQRLYPVEPLSPELKYKDDRQATSLAELVMFAVDTAAGCVWDAVHHPNGNDGREDEYCVLKAQNTLFKVRRRVLARDDSAFRGLETLSNGWTYANLRVIRISETAGKFRDLLWALHHVNPQSPNFVYNTSIFCLLNIAELSRKYHFPSFESWAVDQLYKMLEITALPFSLISTTLSSSTSSSVTLTENTPASPSIDSLCARLLDISFAFRFDALFFLVARRIITQTLWRDYHPGETLVRTIQELSVRRSRFKIQLHQLLGVVYYRMLVSLPCPATPGGGIIFPRSMDVELRMCFLSAHESLTHMWSEIRSSLSLNGGSESAFPSPHAGCKEMWDYYWAESARRAEQAASGQGTADVLGLLKSTMIAVRKIVADSPLVCLECSLAGLEAVDKVRDGIINKLSGLFVYC